MPLLLRLKKMGFGVRGGFQYSYKAGNYMEKDKYQQYLIWSAYRHNKSCFFF